MREKDRLKAENFAMKAEIIANNGVLSDLSDLSPEVENQFLKHILDIEREPDTRIGDLLPEFRYEQDLRDNEIETELNRLVTVLGKRQILFELPAGVPIRMAYRYLTEELIDHKITVPRSKNSHLHLDACTGWCPGCFVVDYCETVHEIWSPEELERERGKGRGKG
ncbi:hypothetical protein H8E88_32110 [candidate division KSB1 bacterium]|nr:hypothetical protein [candidate division KSB1 bacterium]